MLDFIEGQMCLELGDGHEPIAGTTKMGYHVTELQTHKHIADIVSMGKGFAAENGPHLDYDPQEVITTCELVLNDLDREYVNIFLIYKSDEPLGFMYASCGKYLFNRQRYAQQELIYIRPAFRGTRAFLKLVKSFEEWARLRSAVEVWMGSAHNKPFSEVLPRIGYATVGTYHKKRTV